MRLFRIKSTEQKIDDAIDAFEKVGTIEHEEKFVIFPKKVYNQTTGFYEIVIFERVIFEYSLAVSLKVVFSNSEFLIRKKHTVSQDIADEIRNRKFKLNKIFYELENSLKKGK